VTLIVKERVCIQFRVYVCPQLVYIVKAAGRNKMLFDALQWPTQHCPQFPTLESVRYDALTLI